jgi:hypothetical protein
MQKKLYFLNEEEKNRILNLHESRTKKQYLISEQTTCPNSLSLDDVQDKIKELAETLKTMDAVFIRGYYIRDRAKIVYDSIKKLDSKNVFDNVENKCLNALSYTIDTFKDYSKGVIFQGGEDLDRFLDRHIKGFYSDKPDALKYLKPALNIVEQRMSQSESPIGVEAANVETTTTDSSKTEMGIGWADPKFVCVKNIPTMKDAPETKYSKLNKGYYFLDGGYLAQSDYDKGKEYSGSFYCDKLGKIKYKVGEYPTGQKEESKKETAVEKKTGEQEKSYTPPVASGIGRTTRSVNKEIPTLLKQVGVEGTSLTQDAINKLYDKLSKKA